MVVRNVAAGSIATRFKMEEGTPLPRSIVEYYYKSDELGDPMVTEEHITAFGWASYQELDEILNLALRINDFLTGIFIGIGLRLIDFKIEFGRLWEDEDMRIVLADEISPDNCRLWDARTNEKLDKDRFRRDLGNVQEAYAEIARRLGILPEAGPRDLKGPGDGPVATPPLRHTAPADGPRRACREGQGRGLVPPRGARPRGPGHPPGAGQPGLRRRAETSAAPR